MTVQDTHPVLYRDAQSLIKLVLTEMETLAALPPAQACDIVRLDNAKRRVVRRIWEFYREAQDPKEPPAP